jgi:MinD-like ATPase involved in chromosome partitioning or flagellar assembly
MSLVALTSVKGAPGVTSLALLLAATYSGRNVVLVEADEAGSALAARFRLDPDAGISTLYRRPFDNAALTDAARTVVVGGALAPVSAVTGVSSEGRRERLAGFWAEFADFAGRDDDCVYVVDCGRIAADSPLRNLLAAANVTIVVTKPDVEDVYHAEMFAQRMSGVANLHAIAMGSGAYRVSDVAQALSVPVLAGLPDDRKAAAVLCGIQTADGKFAKLPLVKAMSNLRLAIDVRLGTAEQLRESA